MAVKPIPDGYHTITPYVIVEGALEVMEFLKKAFDAKEIGETMKSPDGKLRHGELQIGNSRMMISEACSENKPMPAMYYLYVEDCDKAYASAIKAGGVSIKEPANQFYGDRSGGVRDSAGNQWWVGTHVEDVSPEEMKKRMAEQSKEKAHAK
ncbi:MAG: VOC family protein [Candidatus Melainabacteria bacterium]|nr:VOC family protein [Candidatus Melainabacteria bacterium]